MSQPMQHHAINYIEFTTTDIAKTKSFYEKAFSWNFQDWGPDYISFDVEHAGIGGGFRKGDPRQTHDDSAPLIVIYSRILKRLRRQSSWQVARSLCQRLNFPEGDGFISPMAREMSSQSGRNRQHALQIITLSRLTIEIATSSTGIQVFTSSAGIRNTGWRSPRGERHLSGTRDVSYCLCISNRL